MNNWTSGYIADVGYTFGYYSELNPLRANLAFLNAGLTPPTHGVHCELGFGQGLSVNIHAAASGDSWYANDFNPAQAGFAQALADASGSAAHVCDSSFAEFCKRPDLPDFDSIGLHGIWSWISDENRGIIVDFIARKLKVGGVVYLSYNSYPGWATFAPLRHLMVEHAHVMGSPGMGIINRVDGAIDFAEKLMATHPSYAKANPQSKEKLKQVSNQSRHYLAHEYFNRDWHPMHFSTVAQWLAPAKLDYACSAHYLDHINQLNFTQEQQELLLSISDLTFRQTVRDFMVNSQFRRDYWVKGARRLDPIEQGEALRRQKIILTTMRDDVPLKVAGAIGEGNLQADIYNPVLDVLAGLQPLTLGEVEHAIADRGVSFPQLLEVVIILAGAGHLCAVQSEPQQRKAKDHTGKLNAYLINRARGKSEINFLASPVTGGGVPVGRFEQLFLLSLSKDRSDAEMWALDAWEVLKLQGQKVVKEGKTLESEVENIMELTLQAKRFASHHLPVLRALQVI